MTSLSLTADRTDHPESNGRRRWQLVVFVVLAYGLSWWPWLGRLGNPEAAVVLPIGPSIAALIVVGWVYGRPGRRALLRSTVHARIGRWWWAIVIPLILPAAAASLAILFGAQRPSSVDLGEAALQFAVLPLTMIVAGPLGEELGWRGYLLPHLLRRHTPVVATVLLIPVWAAFHLPLMLTNPGRYGIWWAMSLIGFAFTMTWLHLRTGSVLLAIVFHAVINTAIAAAIQMFDTADQPLAWQITATLWLATGAIVALGPLRNDRAPATSERVCELVSPTWSVQARGRGRSLPR